MDSPASVMMMMMLIMATTSQLPGTSHCMVMSKSSNVSNWCDGRTGQCLLFPREGLDLLEPDDSFRDMVELDDSKYQETRRMLNYIDPYASLRANQRKVPPFNCPLQLYHQCLPFSGPGNNHCNLYKAGRGC
ncbi:hypothetical protein D8674_036080 [Pyrus ussuriensis x Pyrus communis]|uniref:Uncharacterized protein n=1 Tax=Pyrus ussuriensis x Pyrus communis TaxID=2448454 RepID=A0A5N5GSM1_9ROSA|nr:hypothetical protein D8674_036080 [Pyrus ussuriensis x Pyrus communis]